MSSFNLPQRQAPRSFLTVISGALIVIVAALIVTELIGEVEGKAPGLRKSDARPSVLKDVGYVVPRTAGHKIERF